MNIPSAPRPLGSAVTAALIIVGFIFLAPGACGMTYYADAVEEWIANDFVLDSRSFAPAAVIISTGSIVGSILLMTLLIYATRWPAGQRLSLHLAIFAAFVVIFGYIMIFPTIVKGRIAAGFFAAGASNSAALLKLHLTAVAGLILGFLPPFLVWRQARRAFKPEDARRERAG